MSQSWPMEPALISGFCSVMQMRVFLTPPGRNTNPSQVSSQQMLVLIYLPRKDGKLSQLRRKGHTNSQISGEPVWNWGPCGLKAEILQLRQPCPAVLLIQFKVNFRQQRALSALFQWQQVFSSRIHLLFSLMIFLSTKNPTLVQMLSFVYSQLFDQENHLNQDASNYVFSTEGHIFRLDTRFRKKAWEIPTDRVVRTTQVKSPVTFSRTSNNDSHWVSTFKTIPLTKQLHISLYSIISQYITFHEIPVNSLENVL